MIAGWFPHPKRGGAGTEDGAGSLHEFSDAKGESPRRANSTRQFSHDDTLSLMPDSDLITQSSGASHARARRGAHKYRTLDAGNENRCEKAEHQNCYILGSSAKAFRGRPKRRRRTTPKNWSLSPMLQKPRAFVTDFTQFHV